MKTFLRTNMKMKIFSILFAFFMWIYVMAEIDPIVIREIDSVPIQIVNYQDLDLLELTPSYGADLNVRVNLRGRRSVIKSQISKGIKLQGIIKNPNLGENNITIDLKDIDTSIEYTLLPASKSMFLEKKIVLRKSISVVKTGNMADNYEIKEMKMNPSSIYIEGPKSLIDTVVNLQTTFEIQNNDKDFSKKLKVIPVNSENKEVKGITINQNSVFVHAVVVKRKTVPIILDIPTMENNVVRLSGYTIEPNEVVIKGKADIVDSIKEVKTTSVELSKLENSPTLKIGLNLPTGVETNTPDIILKSTLEKIVTKEFNISKERIKVIGIGQMIEISDNINIPNEILVKLTATEKIINSLDETNINLFINLQDYENNPSNVPLNIEVIDEAESIEIIPSYLDFIG